MIKVLVLAGVLAGGLATAAAAETAAVERGRLIAAQRCRVCHAVAEAGDSPHAHVIPFRRLHERAPVEMLEAARRTGVVSGHDEMPMFELGRADAAALADYIESLWPQRPGKPPGPLR